MTDNNGSTLFGNLSDAAKAALKAVHARGVLPIEVWSAAGRVVETVFKVKNRRSTVDMVRRSDLAAVLLQQNKPAPISAPVTPARAAHAAVRFPVHVEGNYLHAFLKGK